jgi:predicted DNA repair protein MutK
MVIALNELEANSLVMQGFALAAVGIVITIAVYGVVAVIVKLDDIGLHLAQRRDGGSQAVGRALVAGVPKLLKALSIVGTAAMLWVGGGILVHGLHEMHILEFIPNAVDSAAHAIGGDGGLLNWLVHALGGAVVGGVVGGIIVALLHLWPSKREAAAAH